MLSVEPGLRGSNDLRVGRKMMNFLLFFSVRGTGGSPTGPDTENRVGDQDGGIRGRPVSSMLQLPGVSGHFVQEQDHLGEITAARFVENVLQLHQQR